MGAERRWRLRPRFSWPSRPCRKRRGEPRRRPLSGSRSPARAAEEPLGVVVVDAESGSRPRPTLVSSAAARGLGVQAPHGPPGRGPRRHLRGQRHRGVASRRQSTSAEHRARPQSSSTASPARWRELVDAGEVGAAVLRADAKASRPLTALAARDLISAGTPTCVVPRPPGLVATRRALAGIEPGGELGLRAARFARRFTRAQDGQAVPITLFLALAIVVAGVLAHPARLGGHGRVALPARGRPCGGDGGAVAA